MTGTAVQPGVPSEHRCLCVVAGESLSSKHLRDCRQSGSQCLLFELFQHSFVRRRMEVMGNERKLKLQQQKEKVQKREMKRK